MQSAIPIPSLEPTQAMITMYVQPSLFFTTPKPMRTIPTISWKIYRNEKLGFEFQYFEDYQVMEETPYGISLGSNDFVYLKISTNQITDYRSFGLCENIDETNINWQKDFPCLRNRREGGLKGAITETTLGGVSAKRFSIDEGVPDRDYDIVQTTGSPKIEAKMYVSGGGLGWQFEEMLSTFKFLHKI